MGYPTISKAGLDRLARLARKKHRREEGRFLAEGRRLVEEALTSPHRVLAVVVDSDRLESMTPVLARAAAAGAEVWSAPEPWLARLTDTVSPQGVVAVLERRIHAPAEVLASGRAVAVLDGVADPGNAGAIVRSAWAFGLGGVLALQGTAELAAPKTLRASMGGGLHLPLAEGLDARTATGALRAAGYVLVATSPRGGEPAESIEWPVRTAFLIGSEAEGLSPAIAAAADRRVSIGQEAGTESLNAAVAAGILFHLHRTRSGPVRTV